MLRLILPVLIVPMLLLAADPKSPGKLPDLKAKEWKEVANGEGLKSWDVKEGKGDAAADGATVKVHYTGWRTDGGIFDSSVERKEPIEFSLKRVIKGWQLGVPGMKPGGVRRLSIPAKIAYGDREIKDDNGKVIIPANSDLVFEIELLEIKK
jgi:FKBP-type peptidyl-prolyl cis-trans isomerase